MKKVVYLSFFPITKKTARDWYFDYLSERKVPVEYWRVAHPKARALAVDESYSPVVREVPDYGRLEEMLRAESRDTSYIVLVPVDGEAVLLLRALSRNECRTYFVQWGQMPVNGAAAPSWLSRVLFRALAHPLAFFADVRLRLMQKAGLIKPFYALFKAGSVPAWVKCGKVVPVSLCDHEIYKSTLAFKEPLVEGPYCVFLDVYLPFHEDLEWVGLRRIAPAPYFGALNRFFALVEKKYGVKVVIAAHPTARYDEKVFQGRTILKGATPRLVKDSSFVISHHSTSVSYAVLNKKPLVFIYTDDMKRVYGKSTMNYINSAAEYLNASLYNIDEISGEDQAEVKPVDGTRYDAYKYEFITSKEIENTPSREIFFREVT